MSVYVCGDIHSSIDIMKLEYSRWPESMKLSDEDYLVILGDFGLVWNEKMNKHEKYWLEWLCDKPYNVCFIDGNHENFTRLYSDEFEIINNDIIGNDARKIYESNGKVIRHLIRGLCYNFNTKYNFLVFGGGQSVDKERRKENISWWKEEVPDIKDITRLNNTLREYNFNFDFVLTHSIPYDILIKYTGEMNNYTKKINEFNIVEKFLNSLYKMITFEKWYCGHYHVDWFYDDKFFICYNTKPFLVC